jgi:hypothetical protein
VVNVSRLTTTKALALIVGMKLAKEFVEAALQVVLEARSQAAQTYGTRGFASPLPLVGPARKDDVDLLEASLAKPLPPSFRAFLALHDGVRELDLGTDILGARKMAELHEGGGPKRLKKILDEIERDTVDGLVIFGTTKGDASMFIFDSNKVDARGEWPVLEYDADDGLLDEYPNFVAFLEDTADTLRMMAPSLKAPAPLPKAAPAKKVATPTRTAPPRKKASAKRGRGK